MADQRKEGENYLKNGLKKTEVDLQALIIPNVFGPFGNPFYNSFIATFSYQLTRNLEPKIEMDSEVGLIFVDELVSEIIKIIENDPNNPNRIKLAETSRYKVQKFLVY